MSVSLVQSNPFNNQAASVTPTWPSNPTANNLLIIVITAGNTVSTTESITTPTGWNAVYGTLPVNTGSPTSSRAAAQIMWRIANGTSTDMPAISTVTNSRNAGVVYEFSSTTGWPATPTDTSGTAGLGTTGTSCATGSFTTSANGGVTVAGTIAVSGSAITITWTSPLGNATSAVQGANNTSAAYDITTGAVAFSSGAQSSLSPASNDFIIVAAAFKQNAAAASEIGSWGVAAA